MRKSLLKTAIEFPRAFDLVPATINDTCEPFIAQVFVKIAFGFAENEIEIDGKSSTFF